MANLTGAQYRDLIAAYLTHNYASRGLEVYTEISLGKSIIGKNRRIDIFCHHQASSKALALEAKTQATQGTADEKLIYALKDMESLPMPGIVVWHGEGFSPGVIQLLRGHHLAVECFPEESDLPSTSDTRELDMYLAQVFGWWDIVTNQYVNRAFDLAAWREQQSSDG